MRFLFVCTANIARSPYAERRAVMLARGAVDAASAGIPGYPGRPIDSDVATVLAERGTDSAGHTSRTVGGADIEHADLVLTMGFTHHMGILERWPASQMKVFGLRQFAAAADTLLRTPSANLDLPFEGLLQMAHGAIRPNSMTLDVPDPYRRGLSASRKAADQIDDALHQILEFIAPRSGRE